MMDDYEKKKKKLGITKFVEKADETKISDEFFARIHPEIKSKLSDLLHKTKDINKLMDQTMGKSIKMQTKLF